jgi:hypothetical protein
LEEYLQSQELLCCLKNKLLMQNTYTYNTYKNG